MSNLILLLLFVAISYFILYLEKENFIVSLFQASFFNDIVGNGTENKGYDLINNTNNDVNIIKKTNQGFKVNSKIELNKNAEMVSTKISAMRKELNSNLKHLEFILTIENQLAYLASKDKCALERLQKYVKIKLEVQLKIIQLSQNITNYNSSQINLC